MLKIDKIKNFMFFKNDILNIVDYKNKNGEQKTTTIFKFPYKKNEEDNTLYTYNFPEKCVRPLRIENGNIIPVDKNEENYRFSYYGVSVFPFENKDQLVELSYLENEVFKKHTITQKEFFDCLKKHKELVNGYIAKQRSGSGSGTKIDFN